MPKVFVVIYISSTSNHNFDLMLLPALKLSFTSLLHQTTTWFDYSQRRLSCHLHLFYIKPQQILLIGQILASCHLHLFYIKPQLVVISMKCLKSCHLHLFYIKPQPGNKLPRCDYVVIYISSTSNHNILSVINGASVLSFTSLLHQTTTLP